MEAAATESPGWSRLVMILSETALISALLYYFGWARTQATFGQFGISLSLLDLATTEYILRSINSAFPPLIGLGITITALSATHRRWVRPALDRPADARSHKVVCHILRVIQILGSAGLALAAIGVIAQDSIGKPLASWLPAVLFVGASALIYGDAVFAQRSGIQSGILVTLAVIGALWLVTAHAQRTGTEFAHRYVATLPNQPEIILYSADRLAVSGPGVTVDQISQDGSRFKFRYAGLRMLIHTNDRYFLVASGWQASRDPMYVIATGDDTRIDVITR